jgi:hypothetical protein
MRSIVILLAATCLASLASLASADPGPADPLAAQLHDDSGPVTGLDAIVLTRAASKTHCGGFAVTAKRTKKLAAGDDQLGAVFALAFPTGLNFDKAKASSLRRFDDWVAQLQKTSAAANDYYAGELATHDPQRAIIATARIVQIARYDATLLARAEIPVDVRAGDHAADKVAAYCEQMTNVAQPLIDRAAEATAVCHDHLATAPAGWWNTVCP